jgi:chromosome segregation ATPase
MRNNNISLENLANLNTNYQEMERENDNYRTQLDNQANQYQGQISSLQSQLDEQRRLLADRQRQAEQERLAAQRRLQESQREQQRLSSIVPNWSAFNPRNYDNVTISAHDLAREFYRSQDPAIMERARTDRAFRNSIDSFLGYPNQGLAIRR